MNYNNIKANYVFFFFLYQKSLSTAQLKINIQESCMVLSTNYTTTSNVSLCTKMLGKIIKTWKLKKKTMKMFILYLKILFI